MIRLLTFGLRVALLVVVVLVMSQIPLAGAKRICDYVGDVVKSEKIQAPIRWIAGKFDFIEGHGVNRTKMAAAGAAGRGKTDSRAGDESDAANPETEDESSDRATLSGLLKN